MIITFKRLILHNFLSFGDADVSLDNLGYVSIKGNNNNTSDLSVSNGSGKSSLFEGIVYALTGETIRGTKDVVNAFGEDGALVELYFDVDNNSYHIIRSKNHKVLGTNLKVYVNGEDKSGKGIRDSEKILKEYLPDITIDYIGSVIVLGQGLPHRFSNNTPSGRKEILEKLSKSDYMIEDLKNKVGKRKEELNHLVNENNSALIKATTQETTAISLLNDAQSKLSSIPNTDDLDKRIEDNEKDVDELKNEIDIVKNEINNNLSQIDELSDKYGLIETQKNNELKNVSNKYSSIISDYEGNITAKTIELNSLEKELKVISNIKDVCPTCHQKIPNIVKPDISPTQDKIKFIKQEIDNIRRLHNEANNNKTNEENSVSYKFNTQQQDIIKCGKELRTANVLNNKKLSDFESKKNDIEQKLAKDKELRASINTQIETYNNDITKYSAMIERAREDKEKLNNTIEDLKSHLDVISKFETALKRDFRGYLLTSVVEYINKCVNEYSKNVYNGNSVSVEINGNDILIKYDNKPYENLSGGERQKVDIIIQMAIRSMLCKFLSFSSNILVVDELFDNLDNIGCQKVVELISSKLDDVNSTFIITHHTDIELPVDREIIIEKASTGISKVV